MYQKIFFFIILYKRVRFKIKKIRSNVPQNTASIKCGLLLYSLFFFFFSFIRLFLKLLFFSFFCFTIFLNYLFLTLYCILKVIGGELQERLIPVPYSKSSTDQAVSCTPFLFFYTFISTFCFFACFPIAHRV